MNSTTITRILLAVEVLLALALTFLLLGEKSLWLDEAISIKFAQHWNWATVRQDAVGYGGNMWFYYLLLHWWLTFGDSEFIARSLSALFAVAAVPACYLLGARLFDRRAGIVAALLLATNFFFIRYAQEVRGYSLLLLLATLSCYFFVEILERPSLKNSLGYIVCSVLATYTHYFGILVLFAQAVSLLFLPRKHLPWKWLAGNSGVVLILIVIFILLCREGLSGHLGWVPQPRTSDIYRLFLEFSGESRRLLLAYFSLCLIAVGCAVLQFRRSGLSTMAWGYVFLITWLWAPVIVTYFFSVLVEPVFWPRYLIISLPALVLLAGVGLTQIRYPWLLVTAVLSILALSTDSLSDWYTGWRKDDWRAMVSFVVAKAQPGDAVIVYPTYNQPPFDYYYDRLGAPARQLYRLEVEEQYYERFPTIVREFLEKPPDRFSRIWLVLRHKARPGPQADDIQSILREHSWVAQRENFAGLHLLLYDRQRPGAH